jgi:hypothetical protein
LQKGRAVYDLKVIMTADALYGKEHIDENLAKDCISKPES